MAFSFYSSFQRVRIELYSILTAYEEAKATICIRNSSTEEDKLTSMVKLLCLINHFPNLHVHWTM